MHVGWDGCVGGVEQGGCDVDVLGECVGGGVRWDVSGPACDEGHAEGFFVHPSFVEPAFFAEEEALVGAVDDEGVVGEVGVVEVVEEAADVAIDASDDAEVVGDVALIFPAKDLGGGHVGLGFEEVCVVLGEGGFVGASLVGGHSGNGLLVGVLAGVVGVVEGEVEAVPEVVGDGHFLEGLDA